MFHLPAEVAEYFLQKLITLFDDLMIMMMMIMMTMMMMMMMMMITMIMITIIKYV